MEKVNNLNDNIDHFNDKV